jgi:hypothetical protein
MFVTIELQTVPHTIHVRYVYERICTTFHVPGSSDLSPHFCTMLLYACRNMTLTKVAYFLYVCHLRTCSGVSVASILKCRFSSFYSL